MTMWCSQAVAVANGRHARSTRPGPAQVPRLTGAAQPRWATVSCGTGDISASKAAEMRIPLALGPSSGVSPNTNQVGPSHGQVGLAVRIRYWHQASRPALREPWQTPPGAHRRAHPSRRCAARPAASPRHATHPSRCPAPQHTPPHPHGTSDPTVRQSPRPPGSTRPHLMRGGASLNHHLGIVGMIVGPAAGPCHQPTEPVAVGAHRDHNQCRV